MPTLSHRPPIDPTSTISSSAERPVSACRGSRDGGGSSGQCLLLCAPRIRTRTEEVAGGGRPRPCRQPHVSPSVAVSRAVQVRSRRLEGGRPLDTTAAEQTTDAQPTTTTGNASVRRRACSGRSCVAGRPTPVRSALNCNTDPLVSPSPPAAERERVQTETRSDGMTDSTIRFNRQNCPQGCTKPPAAAVDRHSRQRPETGPSSTLSQCNSSLSFPSPDAHIPST